jgi:CDP-diacylglycerol--serine O-phosphatidyltransferase
MATLTKVSAGDIFTLANGVLGFVAITYVLEQRFIAATGLIFMCMIMDGLDGYMARRLGSRHSIGQFLDSVSDSVSFVFVPALLVYAELHRSPSRISLGETELLLYDVLVLACAVAILATGLFRLARFSAGGHSLDHFQGMPAPATALLLVLLCLLFGEVGEAEAEVLYFRLGSAPWLILAAGLGASFLMASEIPYPKLRGWMAKVSGLGVLLAITPYMLALVLVDDQELYRATSRTAACVALALTLVYVFGGPVYEKLKVKRSKGG